MTSGEAVKYTSSRHALDHILQSGGFKALFQGAGMKVYVFHSLSPSFFILLLLKFK